MIQPPMRLSFTRDNDLECPYRYQQLNLLGVSEAKALFSERGTMNHRVIGEYCDGLHRIQRPSASKMFWAIFYSHTRRLPQRERDAMARSLENFVWWFRMPLGALRVLTELEMAMGRDGETLSIAQALTPTGLARVDCRTGIGDLVVEISEEETRMFDWKTGFQLFDMWAAQESLQGQGYAYLWMKANPGCQRVSFTLFAPMFKQISTATFERAWLIPHYEAHLARQWERADEIRRQHGTGRWPEQVNYDKACKFCRLPGCRLKQEVTGVS